jgi:hypothetical protein
MLVGVGLLGCESGGQEPSTEVVDEADESDLTSAGSYVPILDYWKTGADQSRWIALRQSLNSAFDNICGDTFCGGDYSNLTSLRFTCSANQKTGALGSCAWVFGGSYTTVAASNGVISVNAESPVCPVPVSGKAVDLAKALLAPGPQDALNRPLPGGTKSAYDALTGCL